MDSQPPRVCAAVVRGSSLCYGTTSYVMTNEDGLCDHFYQGCAGWEGSACHGGQGVGLAEKWHYCAPGKELAYLLTTSVFPSLAKATIPALLREWSPRFDRLVAWPSRTMPTSRTRLQPRRWSMTRRRSWGARRGCQQRRGHARRVFPQDEPFGLARSCRGKPARQTSNVSKAAARLFRDQGGGSFVHFTSTSGLIGTFGQANYSASKMGIVGLSNFIARDMHRFGVRSNCVAPFAWSRLTASIPTNSPEEMARVERVKAMSADKGCTLGGLPVCRSVAGCYWADLRGPPQRSFSVQSATSGQVCTQ